MEQSGPEMGGGWGEAPQNMADTAPGQPVPAPPHSLQIPGLVINNGNSYIPAGFWLRLMAFIVDMLILSALSAIILRIVNLPPSDLGRMLSVVDTLFSSLAGGEFPSLAVMNELRELQRPAEFAGWVHVAMCCAYFTIFHGLMGASPGKLGLGLKLLRSDGKETGIGLAFLRYMGYLLVARLAYTAWVMPFDAQRRTLYDMVLKTNVYKRFGLSPSSSHSG